MNTVFAQGICNPVLPGSLGCGGTAQGGTAFGMLLGNLIGAIMIIGFVVSLMFAITGAFHWITSGGDKTNLEHARQKIISAVIGLLIMASVWAIMTVVGTFIGLDLTRLPIPSMK